MRPLSCVLAYRFCLYLTDEGSIGSADRNSPNHSTVAFAVFCLYLKVAGFGRERAPGDADPAAEMTLQDFQSPPTSPRCPGPVVDGRGDIELPLAGTPSTLV